MDKPIIIYEVSLILLNSDQLMLFNQGTFSGNEVSRCKISKITYFATASLYTYDFRVRNLHAVSGTSLCTKEDPLIR